MSEIATEFERLKYFMSCYYHQDWSLDIGSTNEVKLWEYFYKEEGIEFDTQLETDIAGLLMLDEKDIHRTLDSYQSTGRFWNNSKDAKKWLVNLYDFVYAKTT